MCEDILSQMNPEQGEAVKTIHGPLLVLAGAGTGKTRVITYRIAYMLRNGIKPENILGMTFTNKAAREMKERLATLVDPEEAKKVTLSTFHSLCVKLLHQEIPKLGFLKNFTIASDSDQQSILRQAAAELGYVKDKLPMDTISSLINAAKNSLLKPDDMIANARNEFEDIAGEIYKKYQQILKNQNMVDFDDLLLFVVQIWEEYPEVLEKYRNIYQYLLVDEYQDTNTVQSRMLELLAGDAKNICVVGDDDQSIYGWRGAEIEHIINFPVHYPGAKTVKLEMNYRSKGVILKAANAVIAKNSKRHDKALRTSQDDGKNIKVIRTPDEEGEAQFIADAVYDIVSKSLLYSDIAVVYRSNKMSRLIEQAFRRNKIPYRLVGSKSFFERREILDAVAYLKLAVNPTDDQSLLRILGTPPRGIGDKSIELLKKIREEKLVPITKVLTDKAFLDNVSNTARNSATEFTRCLEKYREAFSTPGGLSGKVHDYLKEIGYLDGLLKMYKKRGEAEMRQENIYEFINSVAYYEDHCDGNATLVNFTRKFTLLDDDSNDDEAHENSVTLLTVHASKGLEYPFVFQIGMEHGMFPHERSVMEGGEEEERRLFYVSITRAKQQFFITTAKTRWRFDPKEKKRRACTQLDSMFISELPEDNVDFHTPEDYFTPMGSEAVMNGLDNILAMFD